MNLELELIPGLSPAPTLQRYVRTGDVVGASTGAAITGTVHATYTHVWVFDFTSLVAGDYWGVVSGVTTPNGRPFPIRLTATKVYAADSWVIMDASVAASPNIPSPVTGLCNVLFSVMWQGVVQQNATVLATLEDLNNTTSGLLASRQITSGTTDSAGNCTLTLIQFAQFTVGGVYRIVVKDSSGRILHNRRVTIPTSATANMEALVTAT